MKGKALGILQGVNVTKVRLAPLIRYNVGRTRRFERFGKEPTPCYLASRKRPGFWRQCNDSRDSNVSNNGKPVWPSNAFDLR